MLTSIQAFIAPARASAGNLTRRIRLSLSLVGRTTGGLLSAFYRTTTDFLDQRTFPAVIRFATHPYVILLTMLLIIPLIVFADQTKFELIGGNWTNVVSASVSSIVLMQSIKHHRENKRLHAENQALHEQHASAIAALHAKVDALVSAPTPPATPAEATPATAQRRPRRTLAAAAIPAQKSKSEASA